jgi:CubicO group peptidase (beta-lactamase class C family)
MRALLFTCCFLLASLWLITSGLIAETGEEKAIITNAELRSLAEKVRAHQDVPALAAGIIRGNARRLAVVGVRKRGTDIAATDDDQWHLGSNTKPMTALLIALLIDLGLLDWGTPLEQVFPEHAEKWSADLKRITPAHLLTHTSGLPPTGPLLGLLLGVSHGSPVKDRASVVKSLHTVKLATKPGEKYEYSNLGYVVLGAVIDRRGKASWEEQIEQRIFVRSASRIGAWDRWPRNLQCNRGRTTTRANLWPQAGPWIIPPS